MFHHFDAVGLEKRLGGIKHGIIGFARGIGLILAGLKFFRYCKGMTGLGQVSFNLWSQGHRAIPSWATFL